MIDYLFGIAAFSLLFSHVRLNHAFSIYDFSAVDVALQAGVAARAYPGYAFALVTPNRVLHASFGGNFTYDGDVPPPLNHGSNPGMSVDSLFDMASCTKVVATTSAVARLYQLGLLALDDPVSAHIGTAFDVNGKSRITVRNCLLHNAGFAPDPVPFWNVASFGCPESTHVHPALAFSCMSLVWQSLLNQSLAYPIGTKYVYSDLSFVTLMFVVGSVVRANQLVPQKRLRFTCDLQNEANALQCYYEAFVRINVLPQLGALSGAGFFPVDQDRCPPTTNDTTYRHRVVQGQVQDPNAYAMGGIAGHAGLFASVRDLVPVMQSLMGADYRSYLNSTTVRLFTTEQDHALSSRALGWNTNDPTVFDSGWNCSCGTLSPTTFMHLGYTGTMLCGDWDRNVALIMLTNRVYPNESNTKIGAARRAVGAAVQAALDAVDGQRPTAQCM
jgi:CubicO group peptidase (beta-lactamase class C family)